MPLTPTIQPRSAIDSSASLNPDDINVVNIRIELENKSGAAMSPHHINIAVRGPAAGFSSKDAETQSKIKGKLLTLTPRSITPVAGAFNSWQLKFDSERTPPDVADVLESVFRASPVPGVPNSGTVANGDSISFTLRDVQVVDQSGETDIVVEEFNPDGSAIVQSTLLTVSKSDPTLAIESFVAGAVGVNAGSADTLGWVTRAATEIHLEGLSDADQTSFTALFPLGPTDKTLHTASFVVRPRNTTTYTLRASNGTVEVKRQVTVMVQDQIQAPYIVVGPASFSPPPIPGDLQIQKTLHVGSSSISETAFGTLQTAANLVVGGFITGNGAVPKGAILMWHGRIADIPVGWALCDGSRGTADLRDKFIVAARVETGAVHSATAYAVGDTGGNHPIAITTANMPSHAHNVTVDAAGGHAHNLLRGGIPPGLQFTGTSGERGTKSIKAGDDSNDGAGLGTDFQPNHSHTATVASTGDGSSFDARPPFFALAFIEKI